MDGKISVRGKNAAKALEVLTDFGRCQTISQDQNKGQHLWVSPPPPEYTC